MAQEQSIAVFYEPETLSSRVTDYRQELGQEIIMLGELGGGVLRFAGAAFPEADVDNIYAQYNERQSEGRGPHFDIYDEGLSEDYPWLGVYNLAGTCAVQAAIMPRNLNAEYARLYPEPTEEAYEARRHLGALVLDSPLSEVYKGTLRPDRGLILPQSKNGPHIVHEVVPEDSANPGNFIKMVVPKQTTTNIEQLNKSGFTPLDELLTKGLGAPEDVEEFEDSRVSPLDIPPEQPPSRRGRGRGRGRRGRRSGRDQAAGVRSSGIDTVQYD